MALTPEQFAVQLINACRMRMADMTGRTVRNVEVSYGEVDGEVMWSIHVYLGKVPSVLSSGRRVDRFLRGCGVTLAEAEAEIRDESIRHDDAIANRAAARLTKRS